MYYFCSSFREPWEAGVTRGEAHCGYTTGTWQGWSNWQSVWFQRLLITFRKKKEGNRSNSPRLPCFLLCFALIKRWHHSSFLYEISFTLLLSKCLITIYYNEHIGLLSQIYDPDGCVCMLCIYFVVTEGFFTESVELLKCYETKQ